MEEISVWVPGNAVTLTASGRASEDWKQEVARAVAEKWSGGYLQEPCCVELTYSLSSDRFWMTAIFNLLKATIDGLSHELFRPSSSGQPGPWSREDFWISQLLARKALEKEGPGVKIDIGPPRANLLHWSGEPLARTFVRGSPPVWPADDAAQRRVEEWRKRLRAALTPISSEYSGTPVALDLRLQIEAERMRSADLDNLCVPTSQGVALVLTGSLGSGGIIREIRAEKAVVDDGELGAEIVVRALRDDADA